MQSHHPQATRSARFRLRRKLKLQLRLLALATAGVAGFIVFAGLARPLNSPAPAMAEIEHLIDVAGYGLTQVSVTGHRYTPDSDILDAVGLDDALTMLSFDSRAAQDRIERLPWIERASIERILPDRLEVRVTERVPIAVWRRGDKNFLIDKSGRVLSAVPANAMPSLPRVAGEGAAPEAAHLLAVLAAYPALAGRVDLAERVGGRRWLLRLADGGAVQLPDRDEGAALGRALHVAAAGLGQLGEIDVRVPDRTLIRSAEGQKENAKVGEPQPTGGI